MMQQSGKRDLLLVTAGNVGHLLVRVETTNIKPLDPDLRCLCLSPRRNECARSESSHFRKSDIVGDAQIERKTLFSDLR